MIGMTRKGMIMYLNEKSMERHARNNPEPPAYAFFQDEYEHRQFELFHEDWVMMGEPKVITLHVYPGDRTEDTRENLESVYQHAEEDMKIAEYKLSYLNKKEDQ